MICTLPADVPTNQVQLDAHDHLQTMTMLLLRSRELTMMDATMKDLCAQQQQLGVEACGSVHSTHRKQPGSIPKSHWWMHAGL
jgi:cell wall assembly regulator SMI1